MRHETARHLSLLAATLALVAAPVLLVRYPPLHDYPFHIARIRILADWASDAVIHGQYEIGSLLLPNAAIDLMMVLLTHLMPVETAGRLFVALTLAATVAGTAALHAALYRRLSLWPLLSGFAVYNWILLYGFLNFLFGVAVALFALALWVWVRERGWALRLAMGALSALAVFFCHLIAFGVYALVIAGLELRAAWLARRTWPRVGLPRLLVAALPLLVPVAVLFLVTKTGEAAGAALIFKSPWGWKPYALRQSLMSGSEVADALALAGVVAIGALLMTGARPHLDGRLRWGLALLGLAFLALPFSLFDSVYADARLPVAILPIAIAATDLRVTRPALGRAAAVVLALLLVARTGVIARDWVGFDARIAAIVGAFRAVPDEATIFAATAAEAPQFVHDAAARDRWRPPLKHAVSFATLETSAFVPATWADPTKQPIQPRPHLRAVKAFQGNNPILVRDTGALAVLVERIRALPPNGAAPAFLFLLYPEAWASPPGTREVARGVDFRLYTIAPEAPGGG